MKENFFRRQIFGKAGKNAEFIDGLSTGGGYDIAVLVNCDSKCLNNLKTRIKI